MRIARRGRYAPERMKIADKVVVVTGGARGIGRAMLRRFAAEKPRALVVADRDLEAAQETAREIGGAAVRCDSGRETDLQALIEATLAAHGRIDLFCSNAGVGSGKGIEASDEEWQRVWDVNVMSAVWASRALLPVMKQPGGLYFVVTASAAGLLSMIGDAPYSVSKHASVALAEWLAITYGDEGLTVSCVCPQFVNTDLLHGALSLAAGATIERSGAILEPDQVAEAVLAGIDAEKFLILPHPEVATYLQRKAADPDRWLSGMRKLKAS